MDHDGNSNSTLKRTVNFRICNVSGFKTEILEICSDDPKVYVLFVPGNPGFVSFYKDFLESLYELLGGTATVTAVGHISHTRKNWEHCRLFSLQQQVDHKVDFIKQELQNIQVPIVLVGHSIGSYILIEALRRSPEKVKYYIGLYPFLMLNRLSERQAVIQKFAKSSIKSALLSFGVASLGVLPRCAKRLIVSKSIGKLWSATAIDAASSHLLQYHTFRNMIFMALSEFEKIKKQVPGMALTVEREGHKHSFCCTEAGSKLVAQHVANLTKTQVLSSSQ